MTSQDSVVDNLLMATFKDIEGLIPRPQFMPGGSFQFEVADVDAAVALALLFKNAGRYTYFRGQRDAGWKVQPSFARLSPEKQQAANAAFNAFRAWARRSPELIPRLTSDDQLVAAAQHHKVCDTTFLDLTTAPAVAGWFATEGAKVGDQGAVYLLDPERMKPIFDAVPPEFGVLRFVEIDVANLWRLQAQSGLFLECTVDLNHIWPLDRIVFRQNGTPGRVERAQIYPEDRSQLDQMIDQHLLLKQREEAMRELLANGKFMSMKLEDTCGPPMAGFGPLAVPAAWVAGPDERWTNIDVTPSTDRWTPAALCEEKNALVELIDRRRRSTHLLVIDAPDSGVGQGLQALIDRIWEGMRPYPYDATDIARAITALAQFEVFFRSFDLGAGHGTMPVARHALIDPVELEFGIAGGGSSRACVSGRRFVGALSEAARRLLDLTDNAAGAVVLGRLAPYGGQTLRLFDPEKLMDLFIDEIIPWQVVSQRNPIAFSWLHITTLGRP